MWTRSTTTLRLTDYPLAVLRSEPNNLHLGVGSADGRQHQLHLVPHTEHRAAQDVESPTPQAHLALQAHRCLLAVPSPAGITHKRVDGRAQL